MQNHGPLRKGLAGTRRLAPMAPRATLLATGARALCVIESTAFLTFFASSFFFSVLEEFLMY
jgi:hypothetical protein